MPEAVSAESVVETAATSALDQIDVLMAKALEGADATDATSEHPPTETDASATSGQPTAEEPHDDPADAQPADAQETSVEADPEAPAQDTPPQKTPSRREAARLQEQLLQSEQRARDLQTQLEQRTAVDSQVRSKYATRLGTPEEKAQLEDVLANPRASVQDVDRARTRLADMRTASTELAPIYQAVEQDVFSSFIRGLNELRTLEGMDEASHQALFKASNGVAALRQMYDVGRKAAAAEFEGEVKGLKASLSELRTKQVARGAQPAAGSGSSAPTGALVGLIGADGLPTDEAIERARSGALRSLGAS